MTFGEGVEFYIAGTPIAERGDTNNAFMLRVGDSQSILTSASFVMNSGTLHYIACGNAKQAVINSTVVLNTQRPVITFVQGSGVSQNVEHLNLTVNNATNIPTLYIAGHGTAELGDADITLNNSSVGKISDARTNEGKITGTVNVMVNGGAVAEITNNVLPESSKTGTMNLTLCGFTEYLSAAFGPWSKVILKDSSSITLGNTLSMPKKLYVLPGSKLTLKNGTEIIADIDKCAAEYNGSEVEQKDHQYSSVVTKPADEGVPGEMTYTCDVCHHSYVEEIPALDHICVFIEDHEHSVTATCTADGIILEKCIYDGCIEKKETMIPATGHHFVVDTMRTPVPASCWHTGIVYEYCDNSGCTETRETEIPMVDHDWGEDGRCRNEGCTEIKNESVVFVDASRPSSGDGHSAAMAMKTLDEAVEKLKATGGTIVIVGEYEIRTSTISGGTERLIITGQYAGRDYGGKITTSIKSTLTIKGPLTFERIKFEAKGAVDSSYINFFSGPSLVFGEGLEFYVAGTELSASSASNAFMVRVGDTTQELDSASFVMNSGTVNYIAGGNDKQHVKDATIVLNTEKPVTRFVQGSGVSKNVGSLNLTINNATIKNVYIAGHGTAQLDSADIVLNNCNIDVISDARNAGGKINGPVNLTINGGKFNDIGSNQLSTEDKIGPMNLVINGVTADESQRIGCTFEGWTTLAIKGNSDLYLVGSYGGPTDDSLVVEAGSTVRLSNATNAIVPSYIGGGVIQLVEAPAPMTTKLLSFTYNTNVNVQGTAIHGNYMVQLSHTGYAHIYDLSSENPGTPIGDFPLGSYASGSTAEANHGNQCVFGTQKWDENDPLPLLYVTIGNGAGYKEDGTGYYARCAVERIICEDGVWKAQLVQVISFNDEQYNPEDSAAGLTVGNDGQKRFIYQPKDTFTNPEGYQKISWGWPAFFVDSDPIKESQGKFYIHSARYRTIVSTCARSLSLPMSQSAVPSIRANWS